MAQLLGAQHTAPLNVEGKNNNQHPVSPGLLIIRCHVYFITEHVSNIVIRGSGIRMSGCLARCICLSAVWSQASCLTTLSSVRWGWWCDHRQGCSEEFQPSGLLPYLSSIPPRRLHWPPVSFQTCQVSPCSAALHKLFPLPEHFSSRYPHVSLTSLHPLSLCSSITFSERPSTWQNYPLPPTPGNHHLVSLTLLYFSLFALSPDFTPISLHKNGGYTRALYFVHCRFPRQGT